jgi:hypothetical protein
MSKIFEEKDLKRKLMNIEIQLKPQSWGMFYNRVMNTYEKGSFYCICILTENSERKVHKYPIKDIFRVIEDYD